MPNSTNKNDIKFDFPIFEIRRLFQHGLLQTKIKNNKADEIRFTSILSLY